MPLRDTDDRDIDKLLEAIKAITGESSLKTELSCGLFQQLKLTLTHGTWYLERSPGGYYILPEYRAGRRYPTRLDAEVAADLILSFDRYIPQIYSRADEEIRRRKEAMLTTEIFKASVIGIISGLVAVRLKKYVKILFVFFIASMLRENIDSKTVIITSAVSALFVFCFNSHYFYKNE